MAQTQAPAQKQQQQKAKPTTQQRPVQAAQPAETNGQPKEPSRRDQMRQMFAEGQTRTEIAKHFEVPYQSVYTATKDVTPPEGSAAAQVAQSRPGRVVLEDGTPRADRIRQMFYDEGKKRSEIAKELGITFQTVYAATKPAKGEQQAETPTNANDADSDDWGDEEGAEVEGETEDEDEDEGEGEAEDQSLFPDAEAEVEDDDSQA
jgi:DNA invertase Pin-like site-specific DNA recombinase